MRFILTLITFLLSLGTFAMTNIPNVPGLGIKVLKEVDGKRAVANGDTVSVHYIGTFEDGKEFDQSYKRGQPLSFTVGKGQVISGWEKGLVGMYVGEKRHLTIPYQLAYGEKGMGGVIPPKATLIFETELVEIKGVSKDEL